MSVNGDASTGPLRLGTGDRRHGHRTVFRIGILMALHERTVSGLGQYLDMTLYDCGMALLHPQAANYFLNDKRPGWHRQSASETSCRTTNIQRGPATSSSRAGNNGQFRKLCEIVGGRNWPTIRASP